MRRLIGALIALSVTCGCGKRSATAYLSVQPTFSPFTFTFSSDGEVSASCESAIVTPLGRFKIGVDYPFDQDPNFIQVVVRNRSKGTDTVYKIETTSTFKAKYKGSGVITVSEREVILDAMEGTAEIFPDHLASEQPSNHSNGSMAASTDISSAPVGAKCTWRWHNTSGQGVVLCMDQGKLLVRPGDTVAVTGIIKIRYGRRMLEVPAEYAPGAPILPDGKLYLPIN